MNLPPSVLTKKQARTFRHDGTNARGEPETIIAAVRYDDECGNGHNTFAITANIYGPHVYRGEETVTHKSGRKLWQFSGGCCHKEVARAFPELAPLIKWHLCSSDGPTHYVANTLFLAGDRDCWGLRKGEFRQHTSRGRQNDGIEGVPCWELKLPKAQAREAYSVEKPAPVVLDWQPYGRVGDGKKRELDAARRTAIWPEATDAELCQEPEVLKAALLARLPALMAEFTAAVESLGFTY